MYNKIIYLLNIIWVQELFNISEFNRICNNNNNFNINYFGSFDIYKSFNNTEFVQPNIISSNCNINNNFNICTNNLPSFITMNNCQSFYNDNGDLVQRDEFLGVSYGGLNNNNSKIELKNIINLNLNVNYLTSNILYYINFNTKTTYEIKLYNNLKKRFLHASIILEQNNIRKLYILNGRSNSQDCNIICNDFISIDLPFKPIGNSVNNYNIENINLPSSFTPRFGHSMILSKDKNNIYIFGGAYFKDSKVEFLNEIWKFNILNNTFINLTENIQDNISINLYNNITIKVNNFHKPKKKILVKLGFNKNNLIIKGGYFWNKNNLIYDNDINEFDLENLNFKIADLNFLKYKNQNFNTESNEIFNINNNSFLNILKIENSLYINNIYYNYGIKNINNISSLNGNVEIVNYYIGTHSFNYFILLINSNIIKAISNNNLNNTNKYFGIELTNPITNCNAKNFVSRIIGIKESIYCNLNGTCVNNTCNCNGNSKFIGNFCETKNCIDDCNIVRYQTYISILRDNTTECNSQELLSKQIENHVCWSTYPIRYCSCNTYGRYGGDTCNNYLCANDCGFNGRCENRKCVCNNNNYVGEDCSIMKIVMD